MNLIANKINRILKNVVILKITLLNINANFYRYYWKWGNVV